ncbi:MAG: hypothetical protein WB424_14105 [Terracidiphilus sp.]
MPAPLPPLLDGPITTANKQVYVDNLLPNATVTVFANGAQVGSATNVNPGAILVPLTATLQQGQKITAKQSYNGTNPNISATGLSDASNAIKVQAVPNPLPTPSFASGLTVCASSIYLGNLLPGAEVHVKQGSNILVNGVTATLTTQSFPVTGTLTSGSSLEAWQTAGGHSSAKVGSLAVTDPAGPLPAPVVAEPLLGCQTAVNLSNLIPTANIEISNAGNENFASTPWNAFELYGMTPLVAGQTLTARQYFTKCDRAPSPTASFTVSSDPPPFPKVSYKPCGNVKQLFVTNLVPGSVLTIKRVVATSSNTNTITVIGSMGVSQPTATVNLPQSFSATDPNGPVSLWLEVLLCNRNLPAPGYTKVAFAPQGGPYGPPALETPLYDCVNVVVVTGTHPGTEIQVFSGSISDPISPTVVATGPKTVVQLWTPLVTNQSIFVKQTGCNANGESHHEVVKSFNKLDAPVIVTPVRPGDSSVQVSNVLIGATVTLLVNGVARSQVVALDTSVSLSTGVPALGNGDMLEAVQSLCTQTSGPGTATATLGIMNLSGVPGTMIQNKPVQLLTTATDRQTGVVLPNLPVVVAREFNPGYPKYLPIGPSSSGFTGSSFDYTPGKTDTTAYVYVTNQPGYEDILGEVTVTPPPAPPPPPPSISYIGSKVYGKNFPCTQCSVSGTFGWGDVPSGPWTGDIVTGITIPASPCDNPLGGQSYGIQVSCVSDPSISVSLTVNC